MHVPGAATTELKVQKWSDYLNPLAAESGESKGAGDDQQHTEALTAYMRHVLLDEFGVPRERFQEVLGELVPSLKVSDVARCWYR